MDMAAHFKCCVDAGLSDVEVNAFALVFHLDQVCTAVRKHREQLG